MNREITSPVAVAIFAKSPIEGSAKTRLIPHLGAAGAAALQRRLIERTVSVACAAEVGPVSIWCTPNCGHEVFAVAKVKHGVTLFEQVGSDLGARMEHTFDTLTPKSPVLLIGTDCTVMEPLHLKCCATLLREGTDAVFLPVEDGGYILIGLRRPAPALFHNMDWSTERIMAETRRRCSAAGLAFAEPATLWDIDRPADYKRAIGLGAF